MAETTCLPGRGLSMLPTVYPRDLIHVRRVDPARLRPGDLVAYPHEGGLTCHRVLRLERRGDGRWLEVRGDAHAGSEWLPEGALVFVVTAVDGRLGHWRVDGPRDRLLRRLALSEALVARALRLGAARAMAHYVKWRRTLGG